MISKSFTLSNLSDLITEIETSTTEGNLSLFRGQSAQHSLLPSIAREDPSRDTTQVEKTMLAEIRRTGDSFLEGRKLDDWEMLVKAQHFGMKTRLLDWTTNPLAALWFACSGDTDSDAFVYWMKVDPDEVRGRSGEQVFEQQFARIFRPRLNNPRIVAQNGWFTVHCFSKDFGRFVGLDENEDSKNVVFEYRLSSEKKVAAIRSLDTLGINSATLFPDIEGLCRYINWKAFSA